MRISTERTPAELAEEAELLADKDAIIESRNRQRMYVAATKYQNESCDANFFALLMGIKSAATLTNTPIPTKAQECLDWLNTLWADYESRKATIATTLNTDFSSHGNCPHSFLEVRTDAEASVA